MDSFGSTFPDFYLALDVGEDATDEIVLSAFRKQILLCHPDKLGPMASDVERASAAARTRVLYKAKETLLDPSKREQYDAERRKREAGSGGGGADGPSQFSSFEPFSMADVWVVWMQVVIKGFVRQYDIGSKGERLVQVLGTLLPPVLGSALDGGRGFKVGIALAMIVNQQGVEQTLREMSPEEQRLFMQALEVLSTNMP